MVYGPSSMVYLVLKSLSFGYMLEASSWSGGSSEIQRLLAPLSLRLLPIQNCAKHKIQD